MSDSSIASALLENFAVFRRNAENQPRLPAGTRVDWDRIASREPSLGLDADTAQHVHVAGRDLWLVPGTAGIGIAVPSPALAAFTAPLAHALAAKMMIWVGRPDGAMTVIGLVPDTNKTVRITTRDGTVIDAAVVNNMYTATSPDGFNGYQLRDAEGTLRTVGRT